MDELVGKIFQKRQIYFGGAEVDKFQTDLFRQCPQRIFFSDEAEIDRGVDDARTLRIAAP